jgi:hypothetical protein
MNGFLILIGFVVMMSVGILQRITRPPNGWSAGTRMAWTILLTIGLALVVTGVLLESQMP